MGNALAAQLAICPTGTRAVALLYAGTTAALSLSQGPGARNMQLHFLCSLSTVVGKRRFWAALTSVLFRPIQDTLDAVQAAMELHWASQYLSERERELGSGCFLLWTVLTAGCANVAFLALMKGLANSGTKHCERMTNQGLWPIVTVCMTMQALKRPDARVEVFGMAEVPSKWYPVSFAVALSLLRGSMQWDMLSSIAAGHLWVHLGLEALLLPSHAFMARLERAWPQDLVGLSALLGGRWIPALGPRSGGGGGGGRTLGTRDQDEAQPRRGGGQNQGFQVFAGAGRRLNE